MASLTLTEARAVVRDYLDAVSDTERYPDATIDRHLRGALSAAIRKYVKDGDDRLIEVVSLTPSAGFADLSTYDPIDIRGVSRVEGNSRIPLGRTVPQDRGPPATDAMTIEVALCRKYDVPASASNPLLYASGAPANAVSHEAFDHLVCAWAAQACATKDKERRLDLAPIVSRFESAVFYSPPTVTTRSSVRGGRTFVERYRYWWDAANRRIGIVSMHR